MKTANAKQKPRKTTPIPCTRCGGGGYVNSVVEGGICFRCRGSKTDPKVYDWTFPADWTAEDVTAFLAEQDRKAADRRAKKDAARLAAEEATWDRNVSNCPALAALAAADVAPELCRKARRYQMTAKQESYAAALLDRHQATVAREEASAARRAAGVSVPAGKVRIVGTVAGFKLQESRFGTTEKMIVRSDEGWAVYVTVPAGMAPARGDTVEFSATVTISDRDPLFGFASRPTGAKILSTKPTE